MKRKASYFLIAVCWSLSNSLLPQSTVIASPAEILKSNKNDTTKLNLLVSSSEQCEETRILEYTLPSIQLADKLLNNNSYNNIRNRIMYQKGLAINNSGFVYDSRGDLDSALFYYQKALTLFEEIKNVKNSANVLNNMAGIYQQKGNVPLAIEHYKKSLALQETLGKSEGLAACFNNLAGVFRQQGDIPKALEYYSKCLKILEGLLSETTEKENIETIKQGIATSLINIGLIYARQGDKIKSIECYNKSLALYKEIGDQSGIATALFNLGYSYRITGDIKKSLEYYNQSLKIRERIGDKEGIAFSLHNIGFIYQLQGLDTDALEYYFKALTLRRSIGNKMNLAYSYTNIADVYLKKKMYREATQYSDSASQIARKLGFPESIQNAERIISKIDSAKGNFAGAFEHYKQYILFRDSINNESTRKASIKNQLNYEFERKEAVLKQQQEKERAVAEEKSRFQKIIIISVISGLVLVIIFAGFIFRTLKLTNRQKEIIEEKQKEILDSIYYAKRIQKSLLPTEKYIEKKLRDLKTTETYLDN